MQQRITILGTGRMGSALARAFITHGHETTVWNRTSSKLAPLLALGAHSAESVVDAVGSADIVVLNVNDYATGEELLSSSAVSNALRGRVLIQVTSGSPRQAREMAAWASQHDIAYLDGAIMATPDLIGGPQCTILYSGDDATFRRCESALLRLGANAVHVGADPGLASALDSAMLMVMWGALFGTLQGVAICKAESFSLSSYGSYLSPFLDAVKEWSLDVVKRVEEERLAGDVDTVATIETHFGAFRWLLELCKDRSIHLGLPEAMLPIFRAAIDSGYAQDDFAMLSRFLR